MKSHEDVKFTVLSGERPPPLPGNVFSLEDCPMKGISPNEGDVHGSRLRIWAHRLRFSLLTMDPFNGCLHTLGFFAPDVTWSRFLLIHPLQWISMICDFFFPSIGGIESHLFCLSQELIARGHKVIIVTHHYQQDTTPVARGMRHSNAEEANGPSATNSTHGFVPSCSAPALSFPRRRVGVRWLTNGLKVYYLPQFIMPMQAALSTIWGNLKVFRDIFLRERIQIVHGHQTFAPFCLEGLLHARTLGLGTCFTDHSLVGFQDTGSILINKVLKFVLSDVHHAICVSYTSRENTVLRAGLDPSAVSVIPNAVIADNFTPDPGKADPNWITIVCITRLVANKGADLLARVIPLVCAEFPNVRFIIGGDGNKRVEVEQMREKYVLQDRVLLLGAIAHSDVRSVLVQGDIFLNTSLTEAFGISIVEAACAGLHVVSTKVGGVPELLPEDLITFAARPATGDVAYALGAAVRRIAGVMATTADGPVSAAPYGYHSYRDQPLRGPLEDANVPLVPHPHRSLINDENHSVSSHSVSEASTGQPMEEFRLSSREDEKNADTNEDARRVAYQVQRARAAWHTHARVRSMYSWTNVAVRTERVYQRVQGLPTNPPFEERLLRYRSSGVWLGLLACLVVAVDTLLAHLLEWCAPAHDVDLAMDFDVTKWKRLYQTDQTKASSSSTKRER